MTGCTGAQRLPPGQRRWSGLEHAVILSSALDSLETERPKRGIGQHKDMEASRSTIIKGFLAREGPQTLHQLYAGVTTRFPEQFKGVSRTTFKAIYIKNLKTFKQITVKQVVDATVLKRLAEDPASRVMPDHKKAWLVTIDTETAIKQNSGEIDLNTHHSKIIKDIEKETTRSKAFWTGDSNKPHDWKAALEAVGRKTSL
ncbi:hypothetical protein H4R19_003901 [Coemansia spiralis]|nr:hypothetical protein H4R19_003901 [Coemansia spiralis]